jgi:serine phosphatase RsbU (regulator of sigma subunit)/integral membrane sensor domain MASE1
LKTAPSIEFGVMAHPRLAAIQPRTWRWADSAPRGVLLLFLVTAASYALGSLPAQILLQETGLSAVFFIPAGISVAFLLRLPRNRWWVVLAAVAVTEVIMDLIAGYPAGAIAGFVAGNTVEPLVGASIVTAACGAVDLARLRHVLWFFVGPVVVATAVGALLGSAPVTLMGDASFWEIFPQWWLGDAVGVILVGCAILAWGSSPDRRSLGNWWGLLLIVGTAWSTVFVIRTELPITYLVLVWVVIAGALFGTRAVAVTGLVIAVTYALEIAFGSGVLIVGIPDDVALQVIKLKLGVFSIAGLVVAAESYEGQLAVKEAAAATSAMEHAQAESRLERHIAIRLQQALLPGELDHPGLEIAARYEAGSDSLLVGGDWYDLFTLPDGRIGITVGDVVGHGLEASAAMGRMRTAVAVLALHTDSPGDLLKRLDEYARGREGAGFATATYAVLDPDSGRLAYASAGHPPMLVCSPTGSTRWLDRGRSQPLHGGPVTPRAEAVTQLEPGSTLLAFSDGLIERRGVDLTSGLEKLRARLAAHALLSPDEVCRLLMTEMGVAETRDDDVVLVAVRLGSAPSAPLDEGSPPLREDIGLEKTR